MLLWFGGITILTVIDQLTKHLAVKYLKETSGIILIPDVLEFQYVENRGMAFGLASGAPDPVFNPLHSAFCAEFSIYMPKILKTAITPLSIIGGNSFSGALGNFIDRAFYGLCHRLYLFFSS